MALTEFQAQRVMLVRSIEQAWNNEGVWSAADAREATRETKDLVGAKTPFDLFVARRADRVLELISKRKSSPTIDVSNGQWLTIIAWLLVAGAFAIGFATDHLVADRRVNIIEYPIVGLILWNLLVFATVLLGAARSLIRPREKVNAPFSDLLARWQLRGAIKGAGRKNLPWALNFEAHWRLISSSLNGHRIALTFHAASMGFAIGALGSLYVRGFFKEYRAGWESTFFSAEAIHAIASVVLAPGAWILNMQIPDAEHIAGLQVSRGSGEIAADWIHLYAGSILVWIIIPRLLLLIVAGFSKWRLQRAFPLPITSIYYTALRAIRGGYRATVLIIPFRYELSDQVKADLGRLLERAHGLAASVSVEQTVIMGHDPDDWKGALKSDGCIAVFVLFNLAATAEADAHGHVLQRVLQKINGRVPMIPIVDTSTYADRDKERFNQRCNQWRNVLDGVGCKPLFLNFLTLDQEGNRESVESRLYEYE